MAEIKKTLGGDRIGSGKKMQVELDGYIRSNFDLSMVNRFSQAPGTIVPCYCNIGQKGDTWNFDLSALVRTKPTTGPLYGSFKFELLFFAADIRLYNGALHNNALNLGLNMQNVVYPKIQIPVKSTLPFDKTAGTSWAWQIQSQNMNPSALMAYLGITNPGSTKIGDTNTWYYRTFNGMPALMYWDVIKNFFLNKQEEYGWFIGPTRSTTTEPKAYGAQIQKVYGYAEDDSTIKQFEINNSTSGESVARAQPIGTTQGWEWPFGYVDYPDEYNPITITISKSNLPSGGVIRTLPNITLNIQNPNGGTIDLSGNQVKILTTTNMSNLQYTVVPDIAHFGEQYVQIKDGRRYVTINAIRIGPWYVEQEATGPYQGMGLIQFPTSNLDKARGIILKNFFEGENVAIGGDYMASGNSTINFPPYSYLCDVTDEADGYRPFNAFTQNGLAIKTYSNDIFNAFLNSETIQQINQQTAASITNGQLNISNLILAEKIYKLQNKIAVAGGTYEDWQEAVYGVPTAPANESPRFIGGMTSEIVFDEVVSSSATEVDGQVSPLGALGGRGSLNGQKGGHFELEVKEDCIIMGLCCITPRIDYSQGNKWFFNLENNDQLHKPELDRIGFQELIGEWMVGADSNVKENGPGTQHSYAMQPAWEHYMTAVNESHGDFASETEAMYMTLNRRYEVENNGNGWMMIKDFTSYIDPTKYNYAFADTTIESQNFWTQVGMDIKVRRVMSSKVMPNL